MPVPGCATLQAMTDREAYLLRRNDSVEIGERDRPGRSSRRPADWLSAPRNSPNGASSRGNNGLRRDAENSGRDARAPQSNCIVPVRENTGTTGLELTAPAAAEALAHFDIPHLIVDGLAVQEHGYPRLTLDVDIVVSDVLEAVDFLTADLSGPFARVPGVADRVVDQRNQVKIDLLPAGKVLRHG
jgi:hypothetical protein